MKKLGRALSGSSHSEDRDGNNGRRSSQGSKNTNGQQSGGATAATGGPQVSTYGSSGGNGSRGGHQPQRGAGGNQGTKRGGGSDRPRDQEYTAASQDSHIYIPLHIRSTVASQSRHVTSTKKPDSSASKVCIKCFVYLCIQGSGTTINSLQPWSKSKSRVKHKKSGKSKDKQY